MEKTYKTYYSVVYRNWGADSASEAWFDDKKEAEKFANQDYRDDVVTHRASNPETIKKYENLVKGGN